MGQWYDIGLQAGKTVAEKVDEFIKKNNFDPENRKTLDDGTVIYSWCMKWNPFYFKDEKKFVTLLQSFNYESFNYDNPSKMSDDEYESTAYKLVAVGDEGGEDELGNEAGYEIFDGLYKSHTVMFPEPFEEQGEISKGRLEVIAKNALAELIFGEEGADSDEMKEWCMKKFNITEKEMNILGL